jgi:hypothetical protein
MVLLSVATLAADAQTLRIQILNGKSGNPVAHEHVNLFRSEGFADLTGDSNIHGFTTDANGVIEVSQIAPQTHSFSVSVDWHQQCAIGRVTFSLQAIFAAGLVSENSCKKKITRSAKPGTLILFVRDDTFFEKMAS